MLMRKNKTEKEMQKKKSQMQLSDTSISGVAKGGFQVTTPPPCMSLRIPGCMDYVKILHNSL